MFLGHVHVVLTLTQAAMIAPTDPLISMASSGSSVMMISSWFKAAFLVTAGKKSIALMYFVLTRSSDMQSYLTGPGKGL